MITVLHFSVDILNYASAHSVRSAVLVHRMHNALCTARQGKARQRNNINLLHERSLLGGWTVREGAFLFPLFLYCTLSFCFASLFTPSFRPTAPWMRFWLWCVWFVLDPYIASMYTYHCSWNCGKSQRLDKKKRENERERAWMTELCTVTPTNGN